MHPRTTLERKLHPCMQALPRRSPAKVLSGLGVQIPQSTSPLAYTTSYSEIQHEPCITCEGQASMPWFEEITSQRDTTGGVACSNLLCLPVRHILSLPSDAAQPTQVPRAKEDARELYAATVSVYPLYETTRQEGDGSTLPGRTLRGKLTPQIRKMTTRASIKIYANLHILMFLCVSKISLTCDQAPFRES